MALLADVDFREQREIHVEFADVYWISTLVGRAALFPM